MQKSPLNDEPIPSTSNGTTANIAVASVEPPAASAKSSEASDIPINLNDFLEFLKLSCHVNDMIARSERTKDTGNVNKQKTNADIINFSQLSNYPLVNELFGLKPIASGSSNVNIRNNSREESKISLSGGDGKLRSTLRTTEPVTYKGLHPKLNEKLDYVINEGIMDSVLSFICPVPIPSPLTPAGRAKAKQQKQQDSVKVTSSGTLIFPSASTSIFSEAQLTSTTTLTPPSQVSVSASTCKEKVISSTPTSSSVTSMLTTASTSDSSSSVVRATVKDASKTSIASTASAARRKSLLLMKDKNAAARQEKKEPEVIIHVCDEVKNTSRDFSCPQNLLVSKMGYFADVTAGQRLDEMDISVHCDIQIFDWLMKWVKHSVTSSMELQSPTTPSTPGPQLDGNNVVPILVSASFLQMEPLLLECLTFCHAHLSEVVRTSTNLACLNDAIVTRLAAMFTNLELEMVRDKKERVTPRLWTKLIQSLCEPESEALRGHFYSMSGLFRCSRCLNCVTNTMKSYVSCVPANIRLNRWGQLISYHVRDSYWDINMYIVHLFKEFKSWRKVYWKLWGHCHYLYCCTCEAHFPVYQMNWCRYHPENPNFLGPVTEGRIAGPAGRYACCGQQAFRYETLPGPNGCQFREHSVLVETDRERSILAIAQLVSENYALCESPPTQLQEMAAAGEINPCWQGISLTPQRCRQGLLPQLYPEAINLKIGRRMRGNAAHYFESSSETETTSTSEDEARGARAAMRSNLRMNMLDDDDYSSSSDGCESEHRMPKMKKTRGKRGRKRQTEFSGRFWSGELSARSNQDHQRDFEEKVMKQVIAYVNKKTGSDQNVPQHPQPMGGTYVRLEAEWREMLKQRHNYSAGVASSASSSNYNTGNAASFSNSHVANKQKHK